MAKKPTPLIGELTTTNYGWTKPTVGSSVDAWGGYVNADLDAIDSVVHGIDARTASAPYVPQAGYVPAINPSRIINGDMLRDQRNNGASGTAVGYTIDRWYYATTQVGKITWAQAGAPASLGFPLCLGFTTSSAFTAAAADTFVLYQPIEGDMVSDFAWGTANAQPVTLSFWAQSSVAGTFSGAIRNYPGATRSYPFIYTLTANTMTKIVVTIPGDTAVGWTMSGNLGVLSVNFDLGSGSNFRTAAGAWASGNYFGVTGAVSVVAVNAANFFLTGVKLEIGTVATPFNRQSLAKAMADCQRYYSTQEILFQGYNTAGNGCGATVTLPVTMRAMPTVTFSSMDYINSSGVQLGQASNKSPGVVSIATAAGAMSTIGIMTASAEL